MSPSPALDSASASPSSPDGPLPSNKPSFRRQVHQIRPTNWENDPEIETWPLGTVDYLVTQAWTNYTLFFRLPEDGPISPKVAAETLIKGLERTLAQIRLYCSTIEQTINPETGMVSCAFVKKRDTSIQLLVQYLSDSPAYPSFADLAAKHFIVGDRRTVWGIPALLHGYGKPNAHPSQSPPTCGFCINVVNGGLVVHFHGHHYANDMGSVGALYHQLAENCHHLLDPSFPAPGWDPKALDGSRMTAPDPTTKDAVVEGPPPPDRHPGHDVGGGGVWLQFHLPKSKAEKLKALASDGSGRVSTYRAFTAFLWRTLSRVRAPLHKPDLSQPLFWCQAVDVRNRLKGEPLPRRQMHNFIAVAASPSTPSVEQPTAGDVISGWSLGRLTQYVHAMADAVTDETVQATLKAVAPIRDKTALNIRIDSRPPMSMLVTDHRQGRLLDADFGFGKAVASRQLSDNVSVPVGNILVYPPRKGEDEGTEFHVAFERKLVGELLGDEEMGKFFVFRGVDGLEDGAKPGDAERERVVKAKL